MTRAFIAALAAAAALFAAGSAGAEDAADLPLRKAGHWEIKTVMDEGFGPREQQLTMCIDADKERNTAIASKSEHAKNCTRYEIKKEQDTTIVDAQCDFDGRKVESITEMSGDFEHVFKISIKSTTSGSERGQSISVKRTITQDGRYLGEDCGTLQAGEAMGTDGHKVVVQ
jgi:hypothetical protein